MRSVLPLALATLTSMAAIMTRELPSLPQAIAGQFVGTAGKTLIVAGGTYWTAPPAEGGRKIWVDRILALQAGETKWRDVGRLPAGLAYGGAVSLPDSMILIGGQTSSSAVRSVSRLRITSGRAEIESLPELPVPATNLAAAIAGGRIRVAGGQDSIDASEASKAFWSWKPGESKWRIETPWPGPPRILAAAAGCGEDFYLISGATLVRTESGTAQRRYLTDAFRYCPSEGWRKLPSAPRPVVAAPCACPDSDAPVIIGGDDGSMAGVKMQPGRQHPGFSRALLTLDSGAGRWIEAGVAPRGLVTTGAAIWEGEVVVAGGEDRPGNRSAACYSIRFQQTEILSK